MKKILVFIFISFYLVSCSTKDNNGKLEQKISISIDNKDCNNSCVVDLSKITPFKWNRFYIFKETTSNEAVEKAINQKYPYFGDVARRLIFLDKNNRIVYHEDIFPNVEGVSNKDIVFHMPDSVNYKVYTTPNFIVTKEKIKNNEYYYILNQK